MKDIGNKQNRADGNPDLSRKISRFTKSLIFGGSDRQLLSLNDHKRINQEIAETTKLLRTALEWAKQPDSELWAKGVNPEKITKEIHRVRESNKEAHNQTGKLVTSQDTDTLLTLWKEERQELSKTLDKLNTDPLALQQEARKKLPELVREVRAKLKEDNIRFLLNQLDEQARKTVDIHTRRLTDLIQKYDSEIIADTYLPQLYGELDSSSRALDDLIIHKEKEHFRSAFKCVLADKKISASESLLQLDRHTSVEIVEMKWNNKIARAFAIARYEYEVSKTMRIPHTDTSHIFQQFYDPGISLDGYASVSIKPDLFDDPSTAPVDYYELHADSTNGILRGSISKRTEDSSSVGQAGIHRLHSIDIAANVAKSVARDFDLREWRGENIANPETKATLRLFFPEETNEPTQRDFPKGTDVYKAMLGTPTGKGKLRLPDYFPGKELVEIEVKWFKNPKNKFFSINYIRYIFRKTE